MKQLELSANEKNFNDLFVFQVSFYPAVKYGFNIDEETRLDLGLSPNHVNPFDFNLVFIPIRKNNHWALVVSFNLVYLKIDYFFKLFLIYLGGKF